MLFGAADPLDPDYLPFDGVPEGYLSFPLMARTVFEPLLAHREKVRG